jgi:integrase
MTALAAERLTFDEWQQKMHALERAALKDKSYRKFPVGRAGARWLRALRYAESSRNTLNSYETVICRLALAFPTVGSLDYFCSPDGVEALADFLDDHWGEWSAETRRQRTAAVRSFFRWAQETGRVPWNPAAGIKPPRRRYKERSAHPREHIRRLIDAQPTLRDQIAMQFLGRMGLRKSELAAMRLADIDLAHGTVLVKQKGGDEIVLPIIARRLVADLEVYVLGRAPAEYLLYPKGNPLAEMDPSSVHRWFKRGLRRAGLPDDWKMHELRHSAADELWRETGNLILAKELLRHQSVATTERYLHPRRTDLVAGLRAVDDLWEAE